MPTFEFDTGTRKFAAEGATEAEAWAQVYKEVLDANMPMPSGQERSDMEVYNKARDAQRQQDQYSNPAADLFRGGFTLGLEKPVAGLATGVGELFNGGSFGQGYSQGTAAYDAGQEDKRREAGALGTGAEIAGSVLSGRPSAKTASGLSMLFGNSALGATAGAANNADNLEDAGVGAGVGGLIGLGGGALANKLTKPKAPDTPAIRSYKGEGMDIPQGAFPLMQKGLDGQGMSLPRRVAAGGMDTAADVLSNKSARSAALIASMVSGNIPAAAMAGAGMVGGKAAATGLRAGAQSLRGGPTKKLRDMMTPEVQAIINGPPSRAKLALMQSLGLSRSEEIGP